MQTRPAVRLTTAAAVLALIAGSALAQTAPRTPAVEAQLRARGEQYHRAPDSRQNPAEVSVTQRLNADVVLRNEQADRADDVTRAHNAEEEAAYRADRAEYREQVADTRAENERREIDATIDAGSRAEFNADQQARYEKAMADWRATTRACETGDTARCRAGQQRPILSDY